jgi:hypothetical protein
VKTDHFLATIDLDVIRETSTTAQASSMDEAFAFWFVASNVSEPFMKFVAQVDQPQWRNGLVSNGFGMNGIIPPAFSGIGVIFTPPGDITVITSDGSQRSSSFDNLNIRKDSINDFDFRRPGVKVTVSVNRNRGVVSVYAYADKSRGQVTVNTKNIPVSGYLGFTGYTGSKGVPFGVNIRQLRAINLDYKSGAGEDTLKSSMPELDKKLSEQNLHVDDLLMDPEIDEETTAVGQIADVNKAISIIHEYLSDTRYRDQTLMQNMMDIRSRADDLEEMVNSLRMEIQYTFSGNGAKSSLKQGIKGLEDLIQLHAQENQNLNELKTKLTSFANQVGPESADSEEIINRFASVNAELESEVVNANFTVNLVIALFGVVVLGMGVMLYLKMKQYEKKHFL